MFWACYSGDLRTSVTLDQLLPGIFAVWFSAMQGMCLSLRTYMCVCLEFQFPLSGTVPLEIDIRHPPTFSQEERVEWGVLSFLQVIVLCSPEAMLPAPAYLHKLQSPLLQPLQNLLEPQLLRVSALTYLLLWHWSYNWLQADEDSVFIFFSLDI